ncbi:hypothetical protein [Leptospira weilii]|uniref:hypothetical protein n=1 Tax=Leptospira weilii TaxID=28184 RepID=UPI001EF2F829|nr:hypothetical protein [Leptospira weilii]ULH27414.1 hypothetical protein FH586_13425 [Leptospira weilii]
MSFQESRLVSKQQIGDAVAIPKYTLFSIPTLKENFLIFEIEQKANYRFLANIKTNTSLKRDKNGTLCSGKPFFENTEDASDPSENDCDNGNYFFGLGVATIITVGTILPVLLVFDWIPALFKIGENESTEETSEVKTIDSCQIKNENAILEYSFGESWNRIKKVPIKNCSAKIPLNQDFKSSYKLNYRLVIDDRVQDSNQFVYHSDGDEVTGKETKEFQQIRKNADRVLDKEEQVRKIAREQQRSEEIAQCESFFTGLGRYLSIKAQPGNSGATCIVTCDKYVSAKFLPAKSWGKLPECINRCGQCWSTLGWENSWGPNGPGNGTMSGGTNYEDLKNGKYSFHRLQN